MIESDAARFGSRLLGRGRWRCSELPRSRFDLGDWGGVSWFVKTTLLVSETIHGRGSGSGVLTSCSPVIVTLHSAPVLASKWRTGQSETCVSI